MEVLILTVTNQTTLGLRPNLSQYARVSNDVGLIVGTAAPISSLVSTLEHKLEIPVIDETKLRGGYDWELTFDVQNPGSIIGALSKLGVELKRAKWQSKF